MKILKIEAVAVREAIPLDAVEPVKLDDRLKGLAGRVSLTHKQPSVGDKLEITLDVELLARHDDGSFTFVCTNPKIKDNE